MGCVCVCVKASQASVAEERKKMKYDKSGQASSSLLSSSWARKTMREGGVTIMTGEKE